MNETFILYLFTRLNALSAFFTFATFIGVLTVTIMSAVIVLEKIKLPLKTAIAILIFCIIGVIITPTQKDAIFIIAGTSIIEATKNDSVKRIASKSLDAVEQILDKYLKKN